MKEQGRRVTDRLHVPRQFSERLPCFGYRPHSQRHQRHHRQSVSRTKLAALKNGKGSARSNQSGCQIDLPRPRLQGYFPIFGKCKYTTDKGDDPPGNMQPTYWAYLRPPEYSARLLERCYHGLEHCQVERTIPGIKKEHPSWGARRIRDKINGILGKVSDIVMLWMLGLLGLASLADSIAYFYRGEGLWQF